MAISWLDLDVFGDMILRARRKGRYKSDDCFLRNGVECGLHVDFADVEGFVGSANGFFECFDLAVEIADREEGRAKPERCLFLVM